VCGLAGEAACLPPGVRHRLSGASTRKARAAARELAAEGAQTLVSFGLAGGLEPELAPGTLLIASEIVAEDGRRFACDTSLAARLPNARLAILAGTERAIATPFAKQTLAAATGAQAVDMESLAVAEVAQELGLALIAVRAVADSAHQAIPPYALGAIAPNGSTRIHPVLLGLIRAPWTLPELLRLSAASRAALAALRDAAKTFE